MYMVIDLGGTNGRVRLCRSLDDPRAIAERKFKMSKDGNVSADFTSMVDAIILLARSHGWPEAIAIAIAGKLHDNRTHLIAAGNLGHWVGMPIADRLRECLGYNVPVFLCNDVEAIGLNEAYFGRGQGRDFMACGWGTGFGMTYMEWVNGLLVPRPGEGGHQQVMPSVPYLLPPPCGCGGVGHIESFVGEAGLRHWYGLSAEQLTKPLWRSALTWVELGVRNALAIRDVGLVVIGGGVICKQQWMLPELQHKLQQNCTVGTAPEVHLATGGEDAGLRGALAHIRHIQMLQGAVA